MKRKRGTKNEKDEEISFNGSNGIEFDNGDSKYKEELLKDWCSIWTRIIEAEGKAS